ncbi:hypothetical protein [Pyrobaculum aerophilum]|uniref:hypothetical protein n=1 Tax=Pyrobaculum aerophilum TaxID=13773 RepID=UPI0015F28B30|nr:hypothetical protein [Pyrobaculum aerophilum]
MDTSINNIDEIVAAYFRKLEELGLGDWLDKVFPTWSTFREIESLSGESGEAVVEHFAEKLRDKIHPEVAAEVLGASPEAAVWLMARRIAMWYLQLALEMGVVRER